MSLFTNKNAVLFPVAEKKFDLERDIQRLTEANLSKVFGLTFISGATNQEFSVRAQEQDFYIDTLAFDESQKSFVIIEYKKDKSISVIDQGFAYLSAMLDHKADVLLEYNNRLGKNLGKNDIDWSQTRVIFIGPKFSTYQKRALSPNLPFELWEVGLYEGGLIEYDQINPVGGDKKTEKKTSTSLTGTAAKEIVTYTVEDHLKKSSQNIQDLFQEMREEIFRLDTRVQEKPVGNYIGYKISWYNFVSVHFYKEKLKIHVRKETISDPEKRFTKVPTSYAWGKTPLWWTEITNTKDLEYILPIIKESYESAPDK